MRDLTSNKELTNLIGKYESEKGKRGWNAEKEQTLFFLLELISARKMVSNIQHMIEEHGIQNANRFDESQDNRGLLIK